jgi:3-phosphoshikimate 1-carboxyvinyltransferase
LLQKTSIKILMSGIAISLNRNAIVTGNVVGLPSSKSVSNRALVLNALAGGQSTLHNLSEARDTQLMQALINSTDSTINVLDAGTTMRFLTGYFAISGQHKIMTGTDRMKERPIAPLVNALKTLGADIRYLGREGYPPFEIQGFSGQKSNVVSVPGNLSSQFISALMLIGPLLPQGLTIQLEGAIGSRPYITMTQKIMQAFGARCSFEGSTVNIATGGLKPIDYTIEPDWSAASYWFSFCALAEESTLALSGAFTHSTQGDQVMKNIGEMVGVKAEIVAGQMTLRKSAHQAAINWNFADCPDLAQTVLPLCAVKGIQGTFSGLESLRIKETDRIAALQAELAKVGAQVIEVKPGTCTLTPSRMIPQSLEFATYHDHRMAMGLAPIATHAYVSFDDRAVVNKSYPRYWDDLAALGFSFPSA